MNGRVRWISMDPEKMTAQEGWRERAVEDESVEVSTSVLAPLIGRIGRQRALQGRLTDALGLDAQYLRTARCGSFLEGQNQPWELSAELSAAL